jgi:hypothetical protein
MTSIGSSDVVPEWGDEERHLFHASVLEAIANFKSPTAYLYHHMPSAAEKKAFLEHLLMTFPAQDDVIYCFDTLIPSVGQDNIGLTNPLVFHVVASEFGDGSSIKPPPGEDLSRDLQEIL